MENRTIVEIGRSLTESQRKKVVNEVASRGQLTGNVVYRYLAGSTSPLYLYKELICTVLNEVLDTIFTVEELWPDA